LKKKQSKRCLTNTQMKMDKTLIKEVQYSHKKSSLLIKFKDGSMHGEIGKIAKKTLKQLNDNNVPYVELDIKKPKKQ
jgi:hypothetical protein